MHAIWLCFLLAHVHLALWWTFRCISEVNKRWCVTVKITVTESPSLLPMVFFFFMLLILLLHFNSSIIFVSHSFFFFICILKLLVKMPFHFSQNAFRIALPIIPSSTWNIFMSKYFPLESHLNDIATCDR